MTEMIHSDEGDSEKGAAKQASALQNSTKKQKASKPDRPTLRTSQDTQVRGYLESITDSEFVRELQQALRHAHQLTGEDWRVEIRAQDVVVICEEELSVSLDSVLDLASDSVEESCAQAAKGTRIKLPAPQKPGPKK